MAFFRLFIKIRHAPVVGPQNLLLPSVFVRFFTQNRLYAVWGSGPNEIWAVGYNYAILHYEGQGWFKLPHHDFSQEPLRSVWGTEGRLWVAKYERVSQIIYHLVPWRVAPSECACSDGMDNDADGLVDAQDPDCTSPPQETGSLACTDGFDNDCDGLIDCHDPDCDGEPTPLENCFDGRDNDCDGLVEAQDSDCATGD